MSRRAKTAEPNTRFMRVNLGHNAHLFSLGRGMALNDGRYVGTSPTGEHWVSYQGDAEFAELSAKFDDLIGSEIRTSFGDHHA